jgi:RNA polymerase sigma-70 factor, ECF subfamily
MATALMPTPTEIPWLDRLRAEGAARHTAEAELHLLLLKAARFEVERRAAELPHLRGGDLEDLAQQAADDALMAVLRKLDEFRGESRFTTWAYKFALLEAAVKVRRRAWQGREIPLEEEAWSRLERPARPRVRPKTRSCWQRCGRRSRAA